MKFFVKIVITGFGLAMGSALFRKLAPHLKLDEKDAKKKEQDPSVETEGGAPLPHGHQPKHAN